jgi:hypothetical protein
MKQTERWYDDERCIWLGFNHRFIRKARCNGLAATILLELRKIRKNRPILDMMPVERETINTIDVITAFLLYRYEVVGAHGGVMLNKSASKWWGKEATNRSRLKYQYVSGVVDCLYNCKLIDFRKGYPEHVAASGELIPGQTSRMKMKRRFLNFVRGHDVDIELAAEPSPPIQLKIGTGKKIEKERKTVFGHYRIEKKERFEIKPLVYADCSPVVQKMWDDMAAFNELLRQTHIRFDWIRRDPVTGLRVKVHHTDFKSYTRQFIRDFDTAGRIYGSWQSMVSKHHRGKIRINGERTVELDYSGLHPKLLLAREGIAYDDDPYTIPDLDKHHIFDRAVMGGDDALIRSTVRALVKLAFNMAVNASSEDGAIRALRDEINKDAIRENGESKRFKAFMRNDLSNDVLMVIFDGFKRQHPAIAKYIGKGVWRQLHKQDSDIAMAVINRFVQECQEPILPLHDSFIVRSSQELRLKETMTDAFESSTKTTNRNQLIH